MAAANLLAHLNSSVLHPGPPAPRHENVPAPVRNQELDVLPARLRPAACRGRGEGAGGGAQEGWGRTKKKLFRPSTPPEHLLPQQGFRVPDLDESVTAPVGPGDQPLPVRAEPD